MRSTECRIIALATSERFASRATDITGALIRSENRGVAVAAERDDDVRLRVGQLADDGRKPHAKRERHAFLAWSEVRVREHADSAIVVDHHDTVRVLVEHAACGVADGGKTLPERSIDETLRAGAAISGRGSTGGRACIATTGGTPCPWPLRR